MTRSSRTFLGDGLILSFSSRLANMSVSDSTRILLGEISKGVQDQQMIRACMQDV